MNEYIQQMNDFFNSRPDRERIIMALGGVLIIYMLVTMTLYRYNDTKQQSYKTQISRVERSITSTNAQANEIIESAKGQEDPNKEGQQQSQQLNQRIELLNQKLKIYTTDVISPLEMLKALREMLGSDKDLKLVDLQTSAAKKISDDQGNEAAIGPAQNIYRNNFAITLKGSYFAILNYLENLEKAPWRIYWDSIVYEVEKYPNALVTINLHTLNTQDDVVDA